MDESIRSKRNPKPPFQANLILLVNFTSTARIQGPNYTVLNLGKTKMSAKHETVND